MTDIVRVVNSDFDKEMTELVNDLYLAYDEESEKRLREDIKKMYNLRIPNIGYILDAVESDNYDTFHGITYTLLKYKKGGILCSYEEGFEKECKTIGYHVCEECCLREDCYDNVMCNEVQWEFGDQTFPVHLCNLLYSVLIDGDLCVYMNKNDFYNYQDLATSYDYGNYDVLTEYYEGGNDKLIIINHAQQTMFDDLFDRDEDGSCYNYGGFMVMLDPFERKRRDDYFLEGGK